MASSARARIPISNWNGPLAGRRNEESPGFGTNHTTTISGVSLLSYFDVPFVARSGSYTPLIESRNVSPAPNWWQRGGEWV